MPTSWPLAAAMGLALFAYGAYDGLSVYRITRSGVDGTGLVTDASRGMTTMNVAGQPCVLPGIIGHRGQTIRISYPRGRPDQCVMHGMQSYHWSLGALLVGGGIAAAAGYMSMQRRAT